MGTSTSPMAYRAPLSNVEGEADYDITWPWDRGPLTQGCSAVLRVKNEAASLPYALPRLFDAGFTEVVVVDNGSTDGTLDVAHDVAATHGASERLVTRQYPFSVARCGSEHLSTAPDSVRALSYFYNWAFSQVSTGYAVKWDGDMVLSSRGVARLRTLQDKLPGTDTILTAVRLPLYVASDRVAYLDCGMRNKEPFGYPVAPDYAHMKAFEWELPVWPEQVNFTRMRQGSCVELKWLDADEFGHWTAPSEFAGARTVRKRREWEVYTALAAGKEAPVSGVVRIEAPAGVHVVDYVVDTWLGENPQPLTGRVKPPVSV